MRRRAFIMAAAASFAATPALAEYWGEFVGVIDALWLDDGRRMQLTLPYEYRDPAAKRWPVPANTIVDGASIPRAFWTVIGGPFEGKYRNASVIHDYYCDDHNGQTWQDVHHMFYAGMRAKNVDEIHAKIMFAAVWWKGPRWPGPACSGPAEDDCARKQAAYQLGLKLLSGIPSLRPVVDALRAELERGCGGAQDTAIRLADVEQMKWLADQIRATNPPLDQVEQLTQAAQARADAAAAQSPALRAPAPIDTTGELYRGARVEAARQRRNAAGNVR